MPRFEKKYVAMKTQSMMQILDNSNKSPQIKGDLVCRLCLQLIEYENFKQHSNICKKQMEKKYLLNIMKKNGCSYFLKLNAIERKLNQNVLIER